MSKADNRLPAACAQRVSRSWIMSLLVLKPVICCRVQPRRGWRAAARAASVHPCLGSVACLRRHAPALRKGGRVPPTQHK